MSVATQQKAALLPMNGSPVQREPLAKTTADHQVATVTELLLSKVRDTPDAVFIQYPASAKGKGDYLKYTVSDIDRLANEAVRQYARRGLKPEVSYFGTNPAPTTEAV